MAPATDAEPWRVASGCTSDHSAEITPSHLIDRKKYTVVGYSNCDSTEPVYIALSDLFLGC